MHSAPPLLALVIIASASCSPYYPPRCVLMPGMAVAPRSGWSSRSRPAVDATRRRRAPTTSSPRRRATAATASILAVGRDDDDDDDDVGDHIDERGFARALPTCVRRPTSPTRCSSRRAASIVRDCTRDDGLLIITCDASGRGGGSKHDGIASVLRARHGHLAPSNTTTDTSEIRYPITARDGAVDTMDVVARRTVPPRSTSSEVAAISLGMRHAMRVVPPHLRRTVLVLSDSESALEFYCGGNVDGDDRGGAGAFDASARGDGERRRDRRTKTRTKTMTERLREDAHRRCLISLTNETANGVFFSRVRSSSRGVGIAIGVGYCAVDSSESSDDFDDSSVDAIRPSREGIGFIDHDVADHLSSIIRSIPNVKVDYDEEVGDGAQAKTGILSNGVESLGPEDIAWLENSDAFVGSNVHARDSSSGDEEHGFWRSIEVVGSEMRSDRRDRNLRRIEIIKKLLGS